MTPFALARLAALVLAAQAAAGAEPTYRVGPGDVLEVTVDGHPELTRFPTVQTTGGIWMPALGEVQVVGLTPAGIGGRLAELQARRGGSSPTVTVSVREYHSQWVWVGGQVHRPGRQALTDGLRLRDVLLEAGGLTTEASGEVVVQRPQGTFADGTAIRRVRLSRAGPTPDALACLDTLLRGDDVVTVSERGFVRVGGGVVRPGRYALDGETMLTAAVASAGGRTRAAGPQVQVSRHDPKTGQLQVLAADLDAIGAGRAPDLVLLAGDEVEVKARP